MPYAGITGISKCSYNIQKELDVLDLILYYILGKCV